MVRFFFREREKERGRERGGEYCSFNFDGVVFEVVFVGVGAVIDGILVLFVGCFFDVVFVVSYVVVEIGYLSKCSVIIIKIIAVRFFFYNVLDNKYRDRYYK